MAPPIRRAGLVTPKRNSSVAQDPGWEQIKRLNLAYNLGVPIQDKLRTPKEKEELARRNPHFGRHDNIANLLRFLAYQGEDQLQSVLDAFASKAREQSILWVQKPHGERGVVPSPHHRPRAANQTEQIRLQEILLEILQLAKILTSRRPSQQRNRTPSPKGVSENTEQEMDPDESLESPSSSPASSPQSQAQSVFSRDDSALPDSQSTVDIFTTPPGQFLCRRPSEDSFDISDSEAEALEESFNLFNHGSDSPTPSRVAAATSESPSSHIPEMEKLSLASAPLCLSDRLASIFPKTPNWLRNAPFLITWELTRMAVHCGVDLQDVKLKYTSNWETQEILRKAIKEHPMFHDKTLPERTSPGAWDAALNLGSGATPSAGSTQVPVFAVELRYSTSKKGPLYLSTLRPPTLDRSYRLARKFGPDRFLELFFPAPHSAAGHTPAELKYNEEAVQEVNAWLSLERHHIAGRHWAAFYVKDAEKKSKKVKHAQISPNKQAEIPQKRVFLFAENGFGIAEQKKSTNKNSDRTGMHVHDMLDWLLQFNKLVKNRDQPYLKFFSRISLGLSRSTPSLIFDRKDLIHKQVDILSDTTGNVMNDGVAQMSLSVARKLKLELGIEDVPTAVHARMGCAKGMWVLDPTDPGQEDWIETYPSQRKWECDFEDPEQRTLEILSYASMPRSAGLNLQFIPILEDRAIDKTKMREAIGSILKGILANDMAVQREAFKHPMFFAAWLYENSQRRQDRVFRREVSFLAGLPDSDEETIQFLLAGGFDPLKQKFLWDIAYKMQRERCEKLLEKLNVRIGRTAYLRIVVDFQGILEEDEVQVCFSSKFQCDADSEPDESGDDGSFSDTLLVDTDVLVGRSPSHFPSDIQRVRAVFRKELCALKDVIVFPIKGAVALADKLSGGDYDGDFAWVCWDPRIVDNFCNAEVPKGFDFLQQGYMRKNKLTLNNLVQQRGKRNTRRVPEASLNEMLEHSFAFNMDEELLGQLTVYKEHLLYRRKTIDDEVARILSCLLSDLVDRPKQGIEFTKRNFEDLRKNCLHTPGRNSLGQPAYKHPSMVGGPTENIIDYLVFGIAQPLIQGELSSLGKDATDIGSSVTFFDPDLAEPAKRLEAILVERSESGRVILANLKMDLENLKKSWRGFPDGGNSGYVRKILELNERWCKIMPRRNETANRKKKDPFLEMLHETYLSDPEHSQWALFRASQAFRMFYDNWPKVLWRLAGRQLQFIKASSCSRAVADGAVSTTGGTVLMTPLSYATSRPDNKLIRQMAALPGGLTGSDDEDGLDDDDD